MDERLSAYALIARAAINVTVPFLIGLFTERLSKLNQVPLFKHQGYLYGSFYDVTFFLSDIMGFCYLISHFKGGKKKKKD